MRTLFNWWLTASVLCASFLWIACDSEDNDAARGTGGDSTHLDLASDSSTEVGFDAAEEDESTLEDAIE